MDNQITSDNNSFTVAGVLSQAWDNVKGLKSSVWAVAILIVALIISVNMLVSMLLGIDPKNPPFTIKYFLIPILTNAIMAPLYAGAVLASIKRARDEKVTAGTAYQYFNQYIPLAIAMLLIGLIASVPVIIINAQPVINILGEAKNVFEVAGGLISSVIYAFLILTIPLIADKNFAVKKAFSHSIEIIKPHWFKVVMLIIIGYLFMFIAIIPLLLGMVFMHTLIIILGLAILALILVWLVPLLFSIQGVIYHRLIDTDQV